MITLIHGIADSNQIPPPYDLILSRRSVTNLGSLLPGEPIAKGSWSFPSYGIYYDDPGFLFFELTATGNTSSVTEYGLVYKNTTNPVYTDDPLILDQPPRRSKPCQTTACGFPPLDR